MQNRCSANALLVASAGAGRPSCVPLESLRTLRSPQLRAIGELADAEIAALEAECERLRMALGFVADHSDRALLGEGGGVKTS